MNDEALRDIFEKAAALPPEDRQAFVAEVCRGDIALQQEVEALLAADANAAKETFWQHSAFRHQALAEGDRGPAIGEIVGHYRLTELIGTGGMGAVYRAERIDAEFSKSVAIKLIHGFFQSPDVISHFRFERQILANLEHPLIARLLDGGTREDGSPYLVMEYIEGHSPNDFCESHHYSTAQRLALFRQICSAVHFAHQNMVIHRDIKPSNILVSADGTPKLLDFGIAKIITPESIGSGSAATQMGMQRLTVRYASPEQIRGEAVTTATDIYSLGVILYELLTGHYPYGDGDYPAHKIMTMVCDEEPLRPSAWVPKLRGDVDNIILRALRKVPQERYGSVDQFSKDVLCFLEGQPVEARSDAPLYVAAKFVCRNKLAVSVSLIMLILLIGGLVEVTVSRSRANRRFNDVRRLAHAVMFDYADAIDKLPGATPVRERLVRDALGYLDDLSKEADTPDLQREIVDAYVRVSNVQGNEYENNLGDTQAALLSAKKAVDSAEALLRKDRSLAALNSSAEAFSTYGSLLYSKGDLASAERSYLRVIDLRNELGHKSGDNLENELGIVTCLNHLGDLTGGYGFQSLGRTTESLAYYKKAQQLTAKLASEFPGNLDIEKHSLATLISLSGAEGAIGRHEDAKKDLSLAVAQIRGVSVAEPQNTTVKVQLANIESRLGQNLLDNRQFPEATAAFADASGILQKVLSSDPTNAIFRRGDSVVEGQWATALRGAGHAGEAVTHSQDALSIAKALTEESPDSAQYKNDVGIDDRKLAESLLAAGDAAGALKYAQQAVTVLCADETAAANPNTLSHSGRAHLMVGNAFLALNNASRAKPALQKAETIASTQSNADPQNAVFRSDKARAEAALAADFVQLRDPQTAKRLYEGALGSWMELQKTRAITTEDAHRAQLAKIELAHLHPPS